MGAQLVLLPARHATGKELHVPLVLCVHAELYHFCLVGNFWNAEKDQLSRFIKLFESQAIWQKGLGKMTFRNNEPFV